MVGKVFFLAVLVFVAYRQILLMNLVYTHTEALEEVRKGLKPRVAEFYTGIPLTYFSR